ncbi:MAG: hypothetical protein EXR55_02705 [Dehalococcoidia bacterium]|nr:hypothetical protein [Dehalococcoidia bacterium]
MAEQEKTFKLDFSPLGEVTGRFNPAEFPAFSDQTISHVREANRHALLAMRSVLDRLIERLEDKEGTTQPTRIPVEEGETPTKGQA